MSFGQFLQQGRQVGFIVVWTACDRFNISTVLFLEKLSDIFNKKKKFINNYKSTFCPKQGNHVIIFVIFLIS